MGKALIIKGANFIANAVVAIKVLTVADFTVRKYFFINSSGITEANGNYAGCDTPISEYAGRELNITALPNTSAWVTFTNKALADSVEGENISVSTVMSLAAGESITLTIPSNAKYLYFLKSANGNDKLPSKINIW